jgi:hypothetical protein
LTAILQHLFKSRIELDNDDVIAITSAFITYRAGMNYPFLHWPIGLFINRLDIKYKTTVPSAPVKEALTEMLKEINKAPHYSQQEVLKLTNKLGAIISGPDEQNKPVKFYGNDEFVIYANQLVAELEEPDKINWYKIIAHAQKASGAKPSVKYLKEGDILVSQLGKDKFSAVIKQWLDFVASIKIKEHQKTHNYNNQIYTYSSYEYIHSPSVDALKGMVWLCSGIKDSTLLVSIARLAEKSYQKIPGQGPAAAALGNACLFTLYKTEGLEGIAQLSRLKLRIRQNNTQSLIEKYLLEAASEQGISVHEIEDLAVDDFGLKDGERMWELEGFKAVLSIISVGKTELKWLKPDGSPQKSVPAAVKEKQPAALKEIKDIAKQIETTLAAQRDRIDRMFRTERILTKAHFDAYYFNHGLMSFLCRKIIWTFKNIEGKAYTVLYLNNKWVNANGSIYEPSTSDIITLWHPAAAGVEEVKAWREFMLDNKLLQPLKQAYREVYLLTDAEVNTGTYSNRMAAHILKQHQFNSLAKIRGWKYSLLGAYDDGRFNEDASVVLPEYSLRAEFWVNEVNANDAFNDTGIWNYVSTDQVRFVNTTNQQVLPIAEVPAIPFSEVMRDVDLFVGVASVSNDPNWRDSGGVIETYVDYWHNNSFGELSEVAKTRKEILTRLVPMLGIAKVAEVKDRFLVVKGKLRTYKIHMGSTNILMEPNDQYLCIVPDRSKKDPTSDVFLPFEGDAGLSVIISKALLLAEDDKITDTTITSQINRK